MSCATPFKVPVHVEVSIRASCFLRTEVIIGAVNDWIRRKCAVFQNGYIALDDEIVCIVDSLLVADLTPGKSVSFWQAELCLHPFRLSTQGPENDFMEGEEELPAAEQWELPNSLLNNLWGSIVIDTVLKTRLLSYCSSSIRFSEAKIDTDIISWNRMILLHGPPGTGKTTICKGLAQKTFIRNSDRFSSGILLEVNSHSLFSKWFSESGKLVMKLFAHIAEIAEDEDCMVVVLIDEVESITSSRGSAARSNEPGDAVRVVNAVLTSLDALKRRPNVLVLCTSNLVDSVDPAFLDRVDLKVYLGPPPLQARYNILHSCLGELMTKGIITPSEVLSQDCLAVEQQVLAYAQTLSLTPQQPVAPTTPVPVAGSTVTQSGARRLATERRAVAAKKTLLAFVDHVTVPDLDGLTQDIEEDHLLQGEDAQPPMELEVGPSEGLGQSDISLSLSQELTPAVGKVSISPPDDGDQNTREAGAERGGHMEVEEPGSTAMELGLTAEQYLYVIASLCENMSGRSLRKLPIKAHSYYLQRPVVSLVDFLCAMHATIRSEQESTLGFTTAK